MNVLTATDLAANAALASIAAQQSVRSEGPASRAMLRLDRVDHYRAFGVLTEGEIARRVAEDLRAQG